MKVNISFTMPKEQHEYTETIKGPDAFSELRRIDEFLRAILKYGVQDESSPDLVKHGTVLFHYDTVEKIRRQIPAQLIYDI